MRFILLMIAAAFCFAAGATESPCVYQRYYNEVMIGQKWQFEVTDLDTDKISTAEVEITGVEYIEEFYESGYSVEVRFEDGSVEKYLMYDEETALLVYSDKKKSYVVIVDYDKAEGNPSMSHWGNHNFTVTEVDYIFANDRARKRMKFDDVENDYLSVYVTGVGFDKFEIHSDDWNHNRSFRLLKTECPDGTTLTTDVYESPRLVPDNEYYEEGMVLVYDWLNVPSFKKSYEQEYRVVGDSVVYNVPCKIIEIWQNDNKLREIAVFDIASQVYKAELRDSESFKPYAIYDLEVGDRMKFWDETSEVTDVFNISIEGIDRRVIKFAGIDLYGVDATYGYWVEGVGPNQTEGFWQVPFFSWTTCLNSMYRNGKLIFRYDSLFRTDGVESIGSDEEDHTGYDADTDDTPIFNLQGIRIDRPVPGQPYIRNGRLIISRK